MKKFLRKTSFWTTQAVLLLSNVFILTYPIAYALKALKKFNPFWIVLDDSRFINGKLAPDYINWLFSKGYGAATWWAEFNWHVGRNRMWNLKSLFKTEPQHPTIGNQKITVVEVIKDGLHLYDGTKIAQNGPWEAFAGLKYIGGPGDDPWQVFSGEIISKEHSILGEGYIWYTINNKLYYRITKCDYKEFKIFNKVIWKGYITYKEGYDHKGSNIHYKFQNDTEWGNY